MLTLTLQKALARGVPAVLHNLSFQANTNLERAVKRDPMYSYALRPTALLPTSNRKTKTIRPVL